MVDLSRFDRMDRLAAAFIAVFGLAQLIVVTAAWKNPLVWDSAVYTAMGKWVFSLGQFGFWENFRPPLLPLLLGFFWKLGLPEIGFPRLLSAGISVIGLGTVYYGSRDLFDGRIALLATAILAATYTYLRFSLEPLTGIAAAILVFSGLYLVQKERPLSGGLVLGLAFLTRFPAALAGPAAVAYIMLRNYGREELWKGVKNSALVTTGFFTFAGAYLALQYWFFGNVLSPFQRSISITAGAGNDYFFGLSYFFKAGLSNPFLLLAPAGIYIAVGKREWAYGIFVAAFLLLYGFFATFPLKIERYILLFLPLMALLSARGLVEVRQYLPKRYWLEGVLIALLLVMVLNVGGNYNAYNWEDPEQQEFFSEISGLDGVVASNDPRVNLYSDFRYYPLPPGELGEVIRRRGAEIDHWAINGRYWDCRGYENCRKQIENLEGYLEENYVVSSKILADSYNYTIYSGESR